jgi:hypothetical protein
VATATLIPDGDGTLGFGTTPIWDNIDEDPATHDGETTFVETLGTDASSFVTLGDTPADFDPANITSITIDWVARVSTTGGTKRVAVQVFKSDEVTALTDEFVKTNPAITYTRWQDVATQQGTPTKADWDGARLRLRWDSGHPSHLARWTAARVIINYTPSGGGATVERAAALDAAAAIAAASQRDLLRSASVDALLVPFAAGERDLLRSAALGLLVGVESAGVAEGAAVERAASLSAAVDISAQSLRELERAAAVSASLEVSAQSLRELLRAAALSADIAVSAEPVRELLRAAALSVSLNVSAEALRELERAAELGAAASVEASGETLVIIERAAALVAAIAIAAAGVGIVVPPPTLEEARRLVRLARGRRNDWYPSAADKPHAASIFARWMDLEI